MSMQRRTSEFDRLAMAGYVPAAALSQRELLAWALAGEAVDRLRHALQFAPAQHVRGPQWRRAGRELLAKRLAEVTACLEHLEGLPCCEANMKTPTSPPKRQRTSVHELGAS